MESKPNQTCVVTVTCGHRHRYVAELIEGARRCGAGGVVVVENGCDAESRTELERMTMDSKGYVTLLELGENRGLAGGFRQGMRFALEQAGFPCIWLLDDDDVPQPSALEELLRAHGRLRETESSAAICLLSVRETKRGVWRAANGASPDTVFLRRNSFCGVHVADLLPSPFRRGASSLRNDPVPLRFAPHGGLWMPAGVVQAIGYPDEHMHLHHDDSEYSSRIPAHNGRLFLVPSSRVGNTVPSCAERSPTHVLSRMLLAESDTQIYYSTRNKTYFECHVRDNVRAVQAINEAAFWLLLYLFAFLYDVPQRRDLVRRAAMEGKSARLDQSMVLPGAREATASAAETT